jgi:predicted metal-binding membrane protein
MRGMNMGSGGRPRLALLLHRNLGDHDGRDDAPLRGPGGAVDRSQRKPRPAARLASPVLFACSYLGVGTAVGVGAFFTYQAVRGTHPGFLEWHRSGATVAGAGLYELTPLKRACLARCRARTSRTPHRPLGAGLRYDGSCVGCSAGLMLSCSPSE